MRRTRRQLLGSAGAAFAGFAAGCSAWPGGRGPGARGTKVDDWQFDPDKFYGGGGGTSTAVAMSAQTTGANSVGLAAGGGKGIANFRNNVEEGYLPIPTDLSYEGLFYDYYFDTGGGSCSGTFCPRYATALDADPLSGEPERYLRVGLDSGLSGFDREPLNLVVVLDVSGSMGSPFSEYYYDRYGNEQTVEEHSGRPKVDVASDAVASMTTHLRPEDRFGVVVFNDRAAVAKPVRRVGETDMEAIRSHIRELEAGGGTRLSAGLEEATALLAKYDDQDRTRRETRSVVVTDAMPNLGETDQGDLRSTLEDNAARHHYTTFVGVGVDFNTEIVDAITAVEGANYYPVHSAGQFERRLAEEFEYVVTPLVFDLSVTLDAADHGIAKVYGTTAAGEATAEVMAANTLFASPSKGGRAKGGVILVQLAGQGGGDVALEAAWETRDGKRHSTTATVRLPDRQHFGDTAVRKAVLLSRYADLLKNWMVYERDHDAVAADGGVSVPPEELGEWERQSDELVVSERYRRRIGTFADHFENEMRAIGDDTLQRELDLLRKLESYDA